MDKCPICKAEDVYLQRIIFKNRERYVCGKCYDAMIKDGRGKANIWDT